MSASRTALTLQSHRWVFQNGLDLGAGGGTMRLKYLITQNLHNHSHDHAKNKVSQRVTPYWFDLALWMAGKTYPLM